MARGKRGGVAALAAGVAEAVAPTIEPRCGACRYFAASQGVAGPGACHRFPPPNDYSPPRMPPTLAHLWCGEFEAAS